MKKIANIIALIVLLIYIVVVSGFVSEKYQGVICNNINIIISDSIQKRFITDEDITALIEKEELTVLGVHLNQINTAQIEKAVHKSSLVKSCDVYTTVDGKLNIQIIQREPIIRIIDKKGKGYFIDAEGSIITLSNRFSPHLLVVNGHINTPFNHKSRVNIYSENIINKTRLHRELHQLAMFINSDKFWISQVVQLYVNSSGELELVPRIGPHLIEFGKIEDVEEKFWKLKTFYTEGLNRVGWNDYIKINLKYKDQIVCTKI